MFSTETQTLLDETDKHCKEWNTYHSSDYPKHLKMCSMVAKLIKNSNEVQPNINQFKELAMLVNLACTEWEYQWGAKNYSANLSLLIKLTGVLKEIVNETQNEQF